MQNQHIDDEDVDDDLPLVEEDIQYYLNKRKPGQSRFTTQRKEPDKIKISSPPTFLNGKLIAEFGLNFTTFLIKFDQLSIFKDS